MPDDELKRHLMDVFEIPPELEWLMEPTVEEVELQHRRERYTEWVQDQQPKMAAEATRRGHLEGWLPEGWRFEVR